MGFALIDAWKEEWPVELLCRVMRVTSRGFRAWRVRPMSQRQRGDLVILAHIREQHRLGSGLITKIGQWPRARLQTGKPSDICRNGCRHVANLSGDQT